MESCLQLGGRDGRHGGSLIDSTAVQFGKNSLNRSGLAFPNRLPLLMPQIRPQSSLLVAKGPYKDLLVGPNSLVQRPHSLDLGTFKPFLVPLLFNRKVIGLSMPDESSNECLFLNG